MQGDIVDVVIKRKVMHREGDYMKRKKMKGNSLTLWDEPAP